MESCICILKVLISNSSVRASTYIIAVFDTLRRHNLSLKPSKCEFMTRKIIYLGFQITESGVAPNPDKVIALQNLEVRKTIRGVRGFLGAMFYYTGNTRKTLLI